MSSRYIKYRMLTCHCTLGNLFWDVNDNMWQVAYQEC